MKVPPPPPPPPPPPLPIPIIPSHPPSSTPPSSAKKRGRVYSTRAHAEHARTHARRQARTHGLRFSDATVFFFIMIITIMIIDAATTSHHYPPPHFMITAARRPIKIDGAVKMLSCGTFPFLFFFGRVSSVVVVAPRSWQVKIRKIKQKKKEANGSHYAAHASSSSSFCSLLLQQRPLKTINKESE